MNLGCEEIRTAMVAGFAEPLEAGQSEFVRRHLADCPDCREYFGALQADEELLAAFVERQRPRLGGLEDRIIDSLQAASPACRSERHHLSTRKVFAAIAAAAVLCVGSWLATRFLTLAGGTSVGLARTLDAMQSRTWVHSVLSGQGGRVFETWQRLDGRVLAFRGSDGSVRYANYADNAEYVYNPNSRGIAVSLLADDHLLVETETPLETVAAIIKSAEQAGAKIRRSAAPDYGANAEAIRIDYPKGSTVAATTLIRDTTTNLLLCMEWTRRTDDAEVLETIAFDYPDPGPQDIYALGVPTDAIVRDSRPVGPAMTLVKRIQERYDRGFGDCQAVVLESRIENDTAYLPMYVSVFRQEGQLKRWDCYQASSFRGLDLPYPGRQGQWPNLSMSQVFDIIASGSMKPSWQMLFDGSRTTTRHISDQEARVRESRTDQFKVAGGFPVVCYLPAAAWPNLYREIQAGSSAHSQMEVLELPADTKRPGWVGLRLVRFAETLDYWFDPGRDDLLMERIRIRQCVSTEREWVKDLGQTSTGIWYPRVIEVEWTNLGPDGVPDRPVRREKRILLESRPALDDALFDPATLTR